MALQVTYQEDPSTPFSESGTFSNPLCFTFDGVQGGVKVANLLIKNTASSAVTVASISIPTADGDVEIKFSRDGLIWEAPLTLNEELLASGTGDDSVSIYMQVKTVDLPINVRSIKDLRLQISTS
jgi:hypothetical protein